MYMIYIEFGKAIIAKSGLIYTGIVDIIRPIGGEEVSHKYIAVTSAGADLLLRTAYKRSDFQHRYILSDPIVQSNSNNSDCSCDSVNGNSDSLVTIAGPLCFRYR